MNFVPPTLEEVQEYIADNPKLSNIDAEVFWHGYNDSGWIDTKGKPVRNWKLKLWTWRNFGTKRVAEKTKLYPIKSRVCGIQGCPMPAVYTNVTERGHVYFRCSEHMPKEVKELYD